MQEDDLQTRPMHENLDTAYVNLAALLRYLRARGFCGRVHVELDEYEADVFLNGEGAASQPRVREINRASGREAEGDDAMQRLLVRSTEPGGLISIYGIDEAEVALPAEDAAPVDSPNTNTDAVGVTEGERGVGQQEMAWLDLVQLSGDLIAAIERATLSFGADFAAMFRAACLELADDFSFLDPSSRAFQYARGEVRLQIQPGAGTYISSISETLRRVVDRLAALKGGRSVRERVALELAVLVRRRETALRQSNLLPYLDRIAGTRVL